MKLYDELGLSQEEIEAFGKDLAEAAQNRAVWHHAHWKLPNSEEEFDPKEYMANLEDSTEIFEETMREVVSSSESECTGKHA